MLSVDQFGSQCTCNLYIQNQILFQLMKNLFLNIYLKMVFACHQVASLKQEDQFLISLGIKNYLKNENL